MKKLTENNENYNVAITYLNYVEDGLNYLDLISVTRGNDDLLEIRNDSEYYLYIKYLDNGYTNNVLIVPNDTYYCSIIDEEELTIETNILDFNEDIYGQTITVSFINKIREEIKFNGLEELVNQLKIDKSYAEKNNIII